MSINTPGRVQMRINGKLYDKSQIEGALRCAEGIVTAYARASEDNGGDSTVEWEDVDYAHEHALKLFSENEIEDIHYQAKLDNDFGGTQ